MQIDRLFEIVYMLLNKKKVTAAMLAKKYNVSVRTIYRDIDTLSNCNIPVYTVKGKNGGLRLLDDFVIDRSMFSEQEKSELLFALNGLDKLVPSNTSSVIQKLASILNKTSTNWIEIDFGSWDTNNNQNEVFNVIKKAIIGSHILSFDYYNSNGDITHRNVEPISIYFKDKTWYLKSYCLYKNDFRMFKLSRIKNIQIEDKNFTPKKYVENTKNTNESVVELVLKIDKTVAYRVYDEFDVSDISIDKDGNFDVHVSFAENEWVYSYILSYGENIKVISPQRIATIIREKAKKIINNI